MQRRDYWFVIKSFILWRIIITVVAVLAIKYIPLSGVNFFGGRYINYITNPLFWSWANFDGEHYVDITRFGYGNGEQSFFPFYPLIIKTISLIFNFKVLGIFSYTLTGILISNVSIIIALFGLYKLVRIDYSERIARLTLVLLLLFPTSYFFGAVYTESLFLALVVWSFYYFRTHKIVKALILGVLSSLTRIVGIIPVGVLLYASYSKYKWNDFFAFFHSASRFGEQRSDHLILLPQVFYRYIVKIIPNLDWNYFPVVFTTLLEITIAVLFLYLIIISFTKTRIEYWIFMTFGYLVPTLSGSFSSLPRYVLVLFPAFIYLATILDNKNKYLRLGIYSFMVIIAIMAQMLFVRGYFVS